MREREQRPVRSAHSSTRRELLTALIVALGPLVALAISGSAFGSEMAPVSTNKKLAFTFAAVVSIVVVALRSAEARHDYFQMFMATVICLVVAVLVTAMWLW
jgi:hypothetical protein